MRSLGLFFIIQALLTVSIQGHSQAIKRPSSEPFIYEGTEMVRSSKRSRGAKPNTSLKPLSVAPLKQAPSKSLASSLGFGFMTEVFGRGGLYSLNAEFAPAEDILFGAGFSQQSLQYGPAKGTFTTYPVYAQIYPLSYFQHRAFFSGGVTLVVADVGIEETQVSVNAGGQSTSLGISSLDLIRTKVPIPSLGLGYEFKSKTGASIRMQTLAAYVHEKIQPLAGAGIGFLF